MEERGKESPPKTEQILRWEWDQGVGKGIMHEPSLANQVDSSKKQISLLPMYCQTDPSALPGIYIL